MIAGQTWSFEQYGAWMSFDFTEVIPEEGMTSGRGIAGVKWNPTGVLSTLPFFTTSIPPVGFMVQQL